jgi:hypothetical protein
MLLLTVDSGDYPLLLLLLLLLLLCVAYKDSKSTPCFAHCFLQQYVPCNRCLNALITSA